MAAGKRGQKKMPKYCQYPNCKFQARIWSNNAIKYLCAQHGNRAFRKASKEEMEKPWKPLPIEDRSPPKTKYCQVEDCGRNSHMYNRKRKQCLCKPHHHRMANKSQDFNAVIAPGYSRSKMPKFCQVVRCKRDAKKFRKILAKYVCGTHNYRVKRDLKAKKAKKSINLHN
jgi:hypothetical protein